MSSPTPTPASPPEPDPFLTVRTAIILLAAAFIGLIAGGLTFLSGGPAAGAVLAGLTGFGLSVPVLHKLIR
ncbi:hypothetical protein PUR71_07015 [Streptomyces sp. SP17BM10]|uniref:hypothetical protein n=1 Tax=Streptomyces sp. SP17BM10 TaxID=3002530 RepID=UPI002E762E09|nr:hypothetical protein [Streptomyces sp. SP17BM10]MEE1782673.1 hypothetical protein [Streptomyces sp. SP17BM10]